MRGRTGLLIMLLFLSTLAVLPGPVSSGETTYSPFSNEEFGDWRLPTLAYASDDDRAFAFRDHAKHEYGTYNIVIGGEQIDKVEIGVEHYEDASGRSIGVRVSWDGGTSWSTQAKVENYFTESLDWIDATGVTDWTEDKLSNTNFLVEVEYFHSSGCFGNDVLVTMANGEYETIQGLSKGDKVMTKEGGLQVVTRYEEHDDMPPLLFLNVTVEDGRSVIIHPDHEVVISEDYSMKLVSNLTLEDSLLSRNGSMIAVSSIEYVMLEDFANIVVSQSLFWAEDLLVHNMVKIPYTAYLDWLPVRITTSSASGPSVSWNCFYADLNNTVRGSPTRFWSDWTDLNASEGLSHYRFCWNITEALVNMSWSNDWINQNDTYYDIPDLNATEGTRVGFQWYANDTSGVEYASAVFSFIVEAPFEFETVFYMIGMTSLLPAILVVWFIKKRREDREYGGSR